MENKNKDRGFNYWAMSYSGKLRRTLWMFPFGVLAIALIVWTSGSVFITVILAVFLTIIWALQVAYTYFMAQREKHDGDNQ
ncbi:hypothetical protein FAM18124_02168 [Lacticaseibacillus paracasei]|uniref:hypothetical protein n=1 Tax=Lacticaseibacillus paracasei TaxID=1597 RepID=UPI000F43BBEA|nr:hypothetical protein [Lacticaseibacillus paracasei]MBM6409845.1 hypothetical protein [Lacticaseibacillus paracasei]RND62190.1 hypothetical protein FAM18124_02168 [Lacticaseibacillus paracasei]RND68798.1 hypothetical protein FAM18129_02249 [Lacticaseibacillus paracasei]